MPLTPWQATVDPCLCQRFPSTDRPVWISLLWGHWSFLLGPGAHKILLCPPRVSVSLALWKLWSNPTGLQSQIPRGFPVPLPYPFVGKSVVGPELSQQCKHFFGIIVLQFVGRLLGGSMGLMVTSSNKTYTTRRASQDCYSQSPCPCAGHRRPMPPQKWTKVKLFSRVLLFATPWTIAHQASLSIGFSQARTLEWVAISFSRGASRPRDRTQVSRIASRRFNLWATREANTYIVITNKMINHVHGL